MESGISLVREITNPMPTLRLLQGEISPKKLAHEAPKPKRNVQHSTFNSQHSVNAQSGKPWALNVDARPTFGCWQLNVFRVQSDKTVCATAPSLVQQTCG
jgi:hypothetical protein